RVRSSLRLLGHRSQLKHVELGRTLRPRNYQPPAERADPLEHAGHVALRIITIGERLVLVAERQAAEEDQPARIIVLPQPSRRPLAAGLLHDRQQVALNLDVAEEGLEALVRA